MSIGIYLYLRIGLRHRDLPAATRRGLAVYAVLVPIPGVPNLITIPIAVVKSRRQAELARERRRSKEP
jgi:hypothetical protein